MVVEDTFATRMTPSEFREKALQILEGRERDLTDGERADLERRLRRPLTYHAPRPVEMGGRKHSDKLPGTPHNKRERSRRKK